MKAKTSIAVLCLLMLSQGCGRHPTIAKLTESSVVLAFGDSLTAGSGAESSESYPSLLAGLLGCRVVNAGVPGEESAAGLMRLPAVLQQAKADLVILCEGGNDMLNKREDESVRNNLGAMVALAREAGADVVLVGVPKPGLFLKSPPFYRQVADDNGIPYDNETLAEILKTPSLKSDQIHPNAEGYRKMAGSLAALIRKRQRE
ncbi:MAG: arylesterase [bacterium]